MKLFVDGQIFQTGALERGMGTLTIELLSAIVQQNPSVDVIILTNRKVTMTTEHRTKLHNALKQFQIDEISLDTPKTGSYQRAKQQLEAYITAHTPKKTETAYLVPALFLFDYYAIFPDNCRGMLIFHDLIPLVMWDYLKDVFPASIYFARFPLILEADIVLANSKSTQQELIRLLGVDPRKVALIGGAAERFTITSTEAHQRIKQLGIEQPYILLTTGGGHMRHKNNLRTAQALYLIKRDVDHPFKVIATSNYEASEKRELAEYLGDYVQFTGSVSRFDMQALYMCADMIIMPSLAEGLGIPLLNGVQLGIPVACSDIPVFSESSLNLNIFYKFDPYDVWDMRDKILAALARVDFSDHLAHYSRINKHFTWKRCAEAFSKSLLTPIPHSSKPSNRLVVLIPDPLKDSSLGYMAQSLLAASQAAGYELHYYIDPGNQPLHYEKRGADYVRYLSQCFDIKDYTLDASGNTPTLIFLPADADFTELHLLSRLIDGAIVYVSDDVSDNLYDALQHQGILDQTLADMEKSAQKRFIKDNLYGAPHSIINAKAVICEHRIATKIKNLTQKLSMTSPMLVLSDNVDVNLNDYVLNPDPPNKKILDFVRSLDGR